MRFNTVGTIIGQRGTGKSLFFLGSRLSSKPEDRALNIPSVLEKHIKNGQKVLVIDTLDHPAYRGLPVMQPKHFLHFNKGAARTWLEPDDVAKLVNKINQSPHFNNTAVVFEDAGKYTERTLPRPFRRLIIDSKQRNIDLLFMYHAWVDTPGDIFTKSDYIQLFKTEDSPEVRKHKIRLFDKVQKVYNQVQAHPSRFFSMHIDTRTQ